MSDRGVLLWDFDGTLGYRPGKWSQALLDVLKEAYPTHTATREDVRVFLHWNLPWHRPDIPHSELITPELWWQKIEQIFTRAYSGLGCSPDEARHLAGLAHQKFLEKSQWFLYEDVLPTLQTLSSLGWQHAILSNHVPELADIIEAVGLAPHISTIFNSALIGYEKPHPQIFHHALQVLGHPQEIWMIGDNIKADIQGARSVGIPAILVRKEDKTAPLCFADLPMVAEFLATQTAPSAPASLRQNAQEIAQ